MSIAIIQIADPVHRHYSKMMAKWKTIFESQLQAFLRQIQQQGCIEPQNWISQQCSCWMNCVSEDLLQQLVAFSVSHELY